MTGRRRTRRHHGPTLADFEALARRAATGAVAAFTFGIGPDGSLAVVITGPDLAPRVLHAASLLDVHAALGAAFGDVEAERGATHEQADDLTDETHDEADDFVDDLAELTDLRLVRAPGDDGGRMQ